MLGFHRPVCLRVYGLSKCRILVISHVHTTEDLWRGCEMRISAVSAVFFLKETCVIFVSFRIELKQKQRGSIVTRSILVKIHTINTPWLTVRQAMMYVLIVQYMCWERFCVLIKWCWSASSHYLNQCWNIVNWTLKNKFNEIINEIN